jgi:hypothetical protein
MLEIRTFLTVPVTSNFNFGFETTHSLIVDISVPVNPGQPQVTDAMTNTDLTLEIAKTDTNVPASSIVLSNPTGQQGTFTFTNLPGAILADGNYRASISKQSVVHGGDQMSADAIRDFYVFAGDANRDRSVNSDDFNILATNFGLSGKTFSQGNFNYDPAGLVNSDDFNVMASRFGTTVPALPSGPNEITVGARPDFKFDTAWVDPIGTPQEQGWRVQYSFSGQFDENPIPYINLPANSTGWLTDAFGDGTRVWFRSRAYGNGQDTAYSPKRYAITHLPVPAITTVTALSATQLKVQFTDNSQNETHFQMYRSTSATGTFLPVGNPIPTGQPTEFTDSGLTPSTTYYYYVRARNAVIDSSPSNTGNATTGSTGGIVLTIPTTSEIDLDWPDTAAADVHEYAVYRSTTSGFSPSVSNQVIITGASAFNDIGLQRDTQYYYIVNEIHDDGSQTAVSAAGPEQVGARTLSNDTPIDGTPADFLVQPYNDRDILVSWRDTSSNETQFQLQQSYDGQTWTDVIPPPPARSNAYIVRDRAAGIDYHYRVRARNFFDASNYTAAGVTSVNITLHQSSVVIVGGHFQTDADLYFNAAYPSTDTSHPHNSVGGIAAILRERGYNVYLAAEYQNDNVLNGTGFGQLFAEIASDVDNRNIRYLSLIGYSHGAGMLYNMVQNHFDEFTNPIPPTIRYVEYIDAIRRPLVDELPFLVPALPETRTPPGMQAGRNWFEPNGTLLIRGTTVPGMTNIQVNQTDSGGRITHTNICNQRSIWNDAEFRIRLNMPET